MLLTFLAHDALFYFNYLNLYNVIKIVNENDNDRMNDYDYILHEIW